MTIPSKSSCADFFSGSRTGHSIDSDSVASSYSGRVHFTSLRVRLSFFSYNDFYEFTVSSWSSRASTACSISSGVVTPSPPPPTISSQPFSWLPSDAALVYKPKPVVSKTGYSWTTPIGSAQTSPASSIVSVNDKEVESVMRNCYDVGHLEMTPSPSPMPDTKRGLSMADELDALLAGALSGIEDSHSSSETFYSTVTQYAKRDGGPSASAFADEEFAAIFDPPAVTDLKLDQNIPSAPVEKLRSPSPEPANEDQTLVNELHKFAACHVQLRRIEPPSKLGECAEEKLDKRKETVEDHRVEPVTRLGESEEENRVSKTIEIGHIEPVPKHDEFKEKNLVDGVVENGEFEAATKLEEFKEDVVNKIFEPATTLGEECAPSAVEDTRFVQELVPIPEHEILRPPSSSSKTGSEILSDVLIPTRRNHVNQKPAEDCDLSEMDTKPVQSIVSLEQVKGESVQLVLGKPGRFVRFQSTKKISRQIIKSDPKCKTTAPIVLQLGTDSTVQDCVGAGDLQTGTAGTRAILTPVRSYPGRRNKKESINQICGQAPVPEINNKQVALVRQRGSNQAAKRLHEAAEGSPVAANSAKGKVVIAATNSNVQISRENPAQVNRKAVAPTTRVNFQINQKGTAEFTIETLPPVRDITPLPTTILQPKPIESAACDPTVKRARGRPRTADKVSEIKGSKVDKKPTIKSMVANFLKRANRRPSSV